MIRSALTKSTSIISKSNSIKLFRWHPPPKNFDSQFGDYPKLPWIPYDKRDPHAYYDDPVHRRNFGETIPEEFDIQDAYFIGEHTPWQNFIDGMKGQVALLGIVFTFFGLAYLLIDNDKAPYNVLPKKVTDYLKNEGWNQVNVRPYEIPKHPPLTEQVSYEYKHAKPIMNNDKHHE